MKKENINCNTKVKNKKEKGITLVALVITIVILIILSAVTINIAFGENGLIQRAEATRDMAANSTVAESENMNSLMGEYINIMEQESEIENPDTRSEVEKARDEGTFFTTTTSLKGDSGDTVWIPGGFKIAEDSAVDADNGIVITNEEGTKQFVWIPVEDYTTMYTEAEEAVALSGANVGVSTTINVYSKIRLRPGDHIVTTGTPGQDVHAREPDILPDKSYNRGDASTLEGTGIDQIKNVLGITGNSNEEILNNFAKSIVDEYNETYKSIKTYKGFYIGRYEIGGVVNTPTVSKGTALTNVNWYQLKKACTNVVSTTYAQTTMVYGNQWDEIMSWLKTTVFKDDTGKVDTDSSSWGNFSDSQGNAAVDGYGTKQITGYSEFWKANNIYDLAGNCFEWTQEASRNL